MRITGIQFFLFAIGLAHDVGNKATTGTNRYTGFNVEVFNI